MNWLDRLSYALSPWTTTDAVRTDLARHEFQLHELRTRMTNAENQAYARAAEVVGLIRAEFASLRSQVDAAVADRDAAVQAGVQSALADDSAADAARVEGLITELVSVLPADVPDVAVPQPGAPAELPDDGEPQPA